MASPIIKISGSEPDKIKEKLEDISLVDNKMVYPDYLIVSKLGFTIGISRGTYEDITSNKVDIHSHMAEELSNFNTDIKIFIVEGFMGMDKGGKIALRPNLPPRQVDYLYIINTMLIACIATGTTMLHSASLNATARMLRHWTEDLFHRPKHGSLSMRPRKAAGLTMEMTCTECGEQSDLCGHDNPNPFSLDYQTNDKAWWLSDIPGLNIGIKRAKAMLKGNTLMDLFFMDRKELKDIDGVGPTIAKKFRDFIDKE